MNRRFAPLLTVLLHALLIPMFLTFAVNWFSMGLSEKLIQNWLRTWAIASLVAVPVIYFLTPVIRKLVGWMVGEGKK